MALPKPIPLYPMYKDLKQVRMEEYPELSKFLSDSELWIKQTWSWGQDFLSYIGRNKSEHTYTRFRSELEKFLLWAFLVKVKPIDEFRKKGQRLFSTGCVLLLLSKQW